MNPDEQKDKIKALKEALDISSKYNKNLWLAFLTLEFYILIVVSATTDYMLLVPDSKVKLPLLNIDIGLLAFFIVAPIVLLGFHFYLLLNLNHHTEKLFPWVEITNTNTSEKIKGFPFIFNYLVYYERGTFLFRLLNVIIYILIFILPLFALIFMQWKFGKYHCMPMTVYHCIIVLLDTGMLRRLWKNIFTGSKIFETKTDTDEQIVGRFSLKRYLQTFGNRFFKPACLTNLFVGISGLISLFIIASMIAIIYFKRVGYLLPHVLDLHDQTLVKTRPVEEILSSGVFGKINSEEDELKLKYGFNLQRRDLINANFGNAKIMLADLSGANLQNAILFRANLQGADLSGANLQRSILLYANLQGANLNSARLQEAYLFNANLQGADLSGANLQGANLNSARLQRVDLAFADLQGADLSGANLQNARLSQANLQGAFAETICLDHNILDAENLEGFYAIDVNRESKIIVFDWKTEKKIDNPYKCKNSEKIKITPNIKKFTEIRKKLSCEIPEVAKKSLILEFPNKEETETFKDEITKYMTDTCPKKLKQARKALKKLNSSVIRVSGEIKTEKESLGNHPKEKK